MRQCSALLLLLCILLTEPVAAATPAPGADCSDQTANFNACYLNGCFKCVTNVWTTQPLYIGEQAAACSSTYKQQIRYNTSSDKIEYCDGTNWLLLAAGSGSCSSPSGLSFTNLTNQSLSATVTSSTATITFTGCSVSQAVSVAGAATAQISINGGAWTTSGSISSGQTLQVRMTTSASVSTTLTATVTVGGSSTNWTTTTRSGTLKVFVTGNSYIGSNLGGLSGADAICQTAANAAGYAGTYKAILSDETTNAKDRLTLSYPIVRADNGATVASANLWAGSTDAAVTGYTPTWTGTHADGTKYAGLTCNSWTGGTNGVYGRPDHYYNVEWVTYDLTSCANGFTLYCIQQ